MTFTDKIIKQCPYCGYESSIKRFGTWEKDGKRGLLGKTPEGFIMFVCPQCGNHIKYDTLSNKFLRQEQKSRSDVVFNLFFFAIIAIVIYFIMKVIF
jgi:predicted RNA-binding Zn-ribbon protein involved in translation (DUF1610 family)